MLIRRVEVDGRLCDVRLDGELVAEIDSRVSRGPGETELDGGGGALLPGLHDHHLHLFGLAALDTSVPVGPSDVSDAAELSHRLRSAPVIDGWVRAVGYHESVAGELDRHALDRILPNVPVRLQHATGALWILNSRALELLGLDQEADPPGVERHPSGAATGRLFRADDLIRRRLGSRAPSLSRVARRLASYGVTGVTDATVANGAEELRAFVAAVDNDELPQRLVLMGSEDLPIPEHPRVTRGPLKVVLDDGALPELDAFVARIRRAHRARRRVAVHCVTRVQLVFACRAFREAGTFPGDRIEHAAIVPQELVSVLSDLRLTVVTQPAFVTDRGDRYLRDVDREDRPWLYRCGTLRSAGIPVAAGSDAPFGDPDPWKAMRAAVARRTRSGRSLGEGDRVSPETALELFASPLEAPDGPPRRVTPGSVADLCLLDRTWTEARENLGRDVVRATFASGRLVWDRGT